MAVPNVLHQAPLRVAFAVRLNDKNCLGTNNELCTAPKWDKCGCAVYGHTEIEIGDEGSGSTDPLSISSVAAYVFTTI
jgi:hypothetical protein